MEKGLHQFYCVLVSFEKADANIRGKFSLFFKDIERIKEYAPKYGISSPFSISTCNRTELYGFSDGHEGLYELFMQLTESKVGELSPYVTILRSKDALRHLIKVTSGMQSQILGDFEIVSQVKNWYKHFKKNQLTDVFTERLINTSLKASKDIKSKTGLSDGTASVSYAAVHYLLEKVDELAEKKILLFGLGKIGRNTCENLYKQIQDINLVIVNRSPKNVEGFLKDYNPEIQRLDDLEASCKSSDILLVATGGDHPLITKKHIPTDREFLIIDLSVPSNVDKEVMEMQNVNLLNVDDLTKVVDETLEVRKASLPEANNYVDHYLNEFAHWFQQRELVPYIQAFQEKLHFLMNDQVKKLGRNGSEDAELNERFIQKLTNRFAKFVNQNPHKAEMATELFTEVFVLDEIEYNEH